MGAETITHRELRNDSGRILREVQAGQSFVVTNNGVAVAELVPINRRPHGGLPVKQRIKHSGLRTISPLKGSSGQSAQEILDDLRGDA